MTLLPRWIDGIPTYTGVSVRVPRMMIQLILDHDDRCPCVVDPDWPPYGDTAEVQLSDPPSERELDEWVTDGAIPQWRDR